MNTNYFYPVRIDSRNSIESESVITTIASESSRPTTLSSSLLSRSCTEISSNFTPISPKETPSIFVESYLNGPERKLPFFQKAKEILHLTCELFKKISDTEQKVRPLSVHAQNLPSDRQEELIIKTYQELMLENEEDLSRRNEQLCLSLKITHFFLKNNLDEKEKNGSFTILKEIAEHAENLGGDGMQELYQEILGPLNPRRLDSKDHITNPKLPNFPHTIDKFEKTADILEEQACLFDHYLQEEAVRRSPYLELTLKQKELASLRDLRALTSSILLNFQEESKETVTFFEKIKKQENIPSEMIKALSFEWGITTYFHFTQTIKQAIDHLDQTIEEVLTNPLTCQGKEFWKQSIKKQEKLIQTLEIFK